ncbi:carboxypeptidase-like regulatory domain-containing protein [Cyclobacterium marinum]|uniref:carboxypeptidase-like regulatory domain-containing protein n=1 Tax=Cyclobacterium marinum TaxID=104 RepID=UPI0030DD46D7|tara:strand:- start:6 stop:1175 length:1170 start_codon:yes stop_codon:yes gene_type:complete
MTPNIHYHQRLIRQLLTGIVTFVFLSCYIPALGNNKKAPNSNRGKFIQPHVFPENENARPIAKVVDVSVSGTVLDQAGDPIPGVTVSVAGAGIGTATDLEGKYSLSVPEGSILVFSFIGFESQRIPVGDQSIIDVTLEEDISSLDEVVVVGYSAKRQSELSSSVAIVGEEDLKNGVVSNNLGTMLQGKVAGLTVSNTEGRPGSATNLVIRGVGSIGAGYGPLYVVDGVIGGSANPMDIASITVLKDAAATGLYGSRAANGVIIITTKKGKSGETKVSYSGSAGISQFRNGNLEMMNSAELYDRQEQGFRNFYDAQVAAGVPTYTNQTFDQYLNNVLPSSLLASDTDWQSLLTRTGHVNQHQLSVSGGSDKTTFYVSGNPLYMKLIYFQS